MRLHPLSRHYGCPTVRRHPRSLAEAFPQDHANPFHLPGADFAEPIAACPPSRASWRRSDAVIAAIAVAIAVAFAIGAL